MSLIGGVFNAVAAGWREFWRPLVDPVDWDYELAETEESQEVFEPDDLWEAERNAWDGMSYHSASEVSPVDGQIAGDGPAGRLDHSPDPGQPGQPDLADTLDEYVAAVTTFNTSVLTYAAKALRDLADVLDPEVSQ